MPLTKPLVAAAVLLGLAACKETPSAKQETAPTASVFASVADPPLPGIATSDDGLTKQLQDALSKRGATYEPRTHHKTADGKPTYTNRLILESSPYLLQHAHNPVNWYAWGDEAFERAKAENKPVLLSVGYSTCHWCHVMERESFEDVEIATFLNTHFICIKVDREQRPDVDDVYMTAVQLMTGRGGWPMTVMLTPDRKPFFGGTYFPARDGDRGSTKGFLSILAELSSRYQKDPAGIVGQAEQISQRMQRIAAPAEPAGLPGSQAIALATQTLAQSFDPVHGGFGRAPKFPTPAKLDLLMRYARRTDDANARAIVTFTLGKMRAGGIYDQIGGGFHRYSTDAEWLVPHFEKMLYDNAQLASVYLAAYQLTGDKAYATTAREILDYVSREMTSPEGGFYSATDADSAGPDGHVEEGLFFTWTPEEVEAALDEDLASLVVSHFGITPGGNFEGRTVLSVVGGHEAREGLDNAREKLAAVRAKRPPPLRDDKIITAWNGLMMSAFAQAAWVLDEPKYAEIAAKAGKHIAGSSDRLVRSFLPGHEAAGLAVASDYAFFIAACIDVFEATQDMQWLERALRLQKAQDALFIDPGGGGYFMTPNDGEALLTRDKPSTDGDQPSANAVSVLNLLRLATYTDDQALRDRADETLSAFSGELSRFGSGMPAMLSAVEARYDEAAEVIIVHPAKGPTDHASRLFEVARLAYLPNRALLVVTEGADVERRASLVPLLEGKKALRDQTTGYVCTRGRCALPTSDPTIFSRQLAKSASLFPGAPPDSLPLPTP